MELVPLVDLIVWIEMEPPLPARLRRARVPGDGQGLQPATGQFQQVLESPFAAVTVVPQTPPAGVDLTLAGVSAVTHTLDPAAPPSTPLSTDDVTVEVLDPATMKAAAYKVGFKPDGAGTVWYLVRTVGAQVDTVINNWSNTAVDENYPVVDGIRVKISSFPLGELARAWLFAQQTVPTSVTKSVVIEQPAKTETPAPPTDVPAAPKAPEVPK